MAKLVTFLLASAPLLVSVRGLPAAVDANAVAARAITLSSLPVTTSYSTAIESLQTATVTAEPSITGSFLTGLPSGGFTKNPVSGPGTTTATVPLAPNETPLDPGPTAPLVDAASPNIFQAIAAGAPPPSIPSRNDHPVQKQHIADGNVPIETNKFYANWFLGTQGCPVWTNPYSLTWAKGTGGSYGMAITHTERNQFSYWPDAANTKYFISPLGIHHIVLSAAELQQDTTLTLERLTGFSTYANLRPDGNAGTRILVSFPVVQGMGMTTALYDQAKPLITSTVFFRSLDYAGMVNQVTHKYRIVLNDDSSWLLYATAIGSVGTPPFTLVNSNTITGPADFVGRIQVSKNPVGASAEASFDSSAGAYAISATISGSASGSTGSYTLSWTKGGVTDRPLLMYALPHHVESFDSQTQAALTDISLVTTTKGYARAIVADHMTMVENDLPETIGFGPWVKNPNGAPGGFENINLNANAMNLINQVGISELSQNMIPQTSLNSMYYSGKGLAKFATIIYTLNTITKNSQYASAGLDRLKDAFNVFVNNTQPEPLVYDQVWKGIVSGASYKAPIDTGLDFGNTLYNDHHFHYGYFVYAAAIIGHLDPTWLNQGINKAWVNALVRDFANPVTDDYFPFQRSFDWYHGHSWAKGLFESGDGKDQESTSEDTFATFGMKMWGRTIQDPNMEARGNIQLAVQARSIHNYFLMESDNKNQPAGFIHNKATGILFENKIDHTTYFGSNPEYIEGIHMIPLNPSSAYTRRKQFVQEEWDADFSNGRAEQVTGGWRGILKANQALIDPQSAYNFFANPGFNEVLDGGASRTWYLAYTAAQLGVGSPGALTDFDSNSSSTDAVQSATPASSGMLTMTSAAAAAPAQTSVETLDMSWALQDKNVEERSLESEWEIELECDDDEETDGDRKRSWWDLLS